MNEYLELFNSIKVFNLIENAVRNELCKKYSWAVPTNKAIKTICKYSPLIEIGAGTGYWGKLIREEGGNIICFDKYANGDNPYTSKKWIDIHEGDESILNKFNHLFNLFICWPPYSNDMAFNCLKTFKGKHLIYIGEWEGCCANDKFFNELELKWDEIPTSVAIPRYRYSNDYFQIYKRRELK